MAPRTKAASAAAKGPPLSALAARKAREQAQANKSGTRKASSSQDHVAASPSRSTCKPSEDADVSLEVIIPLPSASQAAASRSTLPSPSANRTPSSALKRPRRSSPAQDTPSLAANRARRNSNAASSQPESSPKSAKTTKGKASQTTPSRSSAKKQPAIQATPASSKKKGKERYVSIANHDDGDDDDDDELNRDIEKILADFHVGNATSDIEASGPEEPPPKKRAKQSVSTRTPVKQPKQTPSKRIPVKKAASAKTSPKMSSTKKSAADEAVSDLEERKTPESKPKDSSTKAKQPVKKKLTVEQARVREAKRYFAAVASRGGKKHVGPSAMPIEDEATGFLAFGNDDDDDGDESMQANDVQGQDEDEAQEGEEEQSCPDSDDSSEDEEQQAPQFGSNGRQKRVLGKADKRRHPADAKGKGRQTMQTYTPTKIVLDDDEEEEEDDASDADDALTRSSALTRQALLEAVPYSNFIPVLEGESRNTIVVENKRKRGKEALYFGLRTGDSLVFLGVGHIEILHGSVQLGGAVLSSSAPGFKSADVFAPISNPLPVLKSISTSRYPGQGVASGDSQNSSTNIFSDLNADKLFEATFDSIVKVTPLASPITALGQVCPIGGLATPFSAPPSLELSNKVHQLAGLKVLLDPSIDEIVRKPRNLLADGTFSTVGLSATYIPHKWQASLHHLSAAALSAAQHPQEEAVVALVRGNKKVGKSTLSRIALERLLSMGTAIGGKVAYLELDIGQSDFGPPGMVALHIFSINDKVVSAVTEEETDAAEPAPQNASDIEQPEAAPRSNPSRIAQNCITLGPGWCQPRVPVRAHFIGDVSPRDDPESYVAAVHDLIDFFRAQVQPGESNGNGQSQRVPLVVNTQGWIKGLGADLAVRLEPMLRPTHIFDVIPRGSPDPVPPPARGQPWLDAEGAILGSGPEIVTLESVTQLEFVQGSFGGDSKRSESGGKQPNGTNDADGPGDGGSTPPRYITEVGSKIASAESRLLNVMSYLYATQLAPAETGSATHVQGSWDFSEPLVHRRPLVVDVAEGLKAGIRVLALGSSVPDSLKLMALNSSIVAIVVTDNSDAAQHLDAPQGAETDVETQKQRAAAGPWRQAFDRAAQIAQSGLALSTRCVGLGIVRSIDAESGRVHLLTPLHPAFLSGIQATTGANIGLVKGALELPVWASLDFEAIKEARESRLDVPPTNLAAFDGEQQQQQLLAGMPRNQVPYLEWPHSANPPPRHNGKRATANGSSSSSAAAANPIQLGSEKRRIRRNIMRKSQFV